MFKRKPIYIVGIVIFTMLLLADLAVYFLVPTGGMGMRPNGGNFDFSNMGDFDFDSMGNFDFSNMGDFDFSNMGNMGNMGGQTGGGLLTSMRNAFWPILIICLLGDGLCIYMLLRISRQEQEGLEVQEVGVDELTRRSRNNVVLAAVAGVLVIAVVLMSLPNGNTGATREAEASVQEAVAEYAELVNVFSGSGTLQQSDPVQTQIPAGVKILSYSVEKGDTVEAGDELAQVDQNSVLKAMYEVQELLSELDAELAEVLDDMLDDQVIAQADGRVKAIYVSKGDSVASAMYDNGALILISLGGSMTVVLESDESVTVGQSLVVTLSDGTKVEGKVQQAYNGKITVTTTDDGPIPGDTVTVADEDGNTIGTGTLNVSSPLKIMAYAGTVSGISVSVNEQVQLGDVLLTLEDTQDTARYEALLDTRQELTDLMERLAQMYQDGVIRASSSGIVSALGEDTAASSSTVTNTTTGNSMSSMGSGSMGGSMGGSSMGGSSMGGSSMGGSTQTPSAGGSFGSPTENEEEAVYEVEMSAVCAVTPGERMTIDISVDELDILSLSAGQEASITLDALPGQSFDGSIQKINTEGTNDGGSTKYTVTVEVDRTNQMLIGMNASVRVQVGTLPDILTVPAAAVYEDGNRTYVYTALDEKTGEPVNAVDVTTGSSDGERIEILSGLTSGDAVYYSYADSIVYRFAN